MDSRSTLKKNYEFRRLYDKGRSAATAYLVVYCRKNGSTQNRVGFTVSTKLGGAVVRNRVRRRLREVFRLNDSRVKQGYDFILVARTRAVTSSFEELMRTYRKLLKELALWEEEV